MRIRWSGQANRDINSIVGYLGSRSARGVRTVLSRIEARVASLAEHPMIGPQIAGSAARLLVVTRTNYVVLYRVDVDGIVVLRVLHGAQDRPPPPKV